MHKISGDNLKSMVDLVAYVHMIWICATILSCSILPSSVKKDDFILLFHMVRNLRLKNKPQIPSIEIIFLEVFLRGFVPNAIEFDIAYTNASIEKIIS